jgi:hypothetical protein
MHASDVHERLPLVQVHELQPSPAAKVSPDWYVKPPRWHSPPPVLLPAGSKPIRPQPTISVTTTANHFISCVLAGAYQHRTASAGSGDVVRVTESPARGP